MEGIELFLSINNGNGYGNGNGNGNGYGNGNGNGYGYGYGNGNGDGDGYGNGNGYGYGYGNGNGYGYGYGNGNGDGNGNGNGYGNGNGNGVLTINENKVYKIDGVNTIIDKLIRNNLAKGRILNTDLTFTDCFIAKVGNYFAHADTVEQAFKEVKEKFEDNLPIEERIKKFVDQFKAGELYSIEEFSIAHNKLTGSCQMGRDSFLKGVESKKYTPEEFIQKTEGSFGGSTIQMLKPHYKVVY